MSIEKDKKEVKHITLSTDRPNATKPQKILSDFGSSSEKDQQRSRYLIPRQQAKSFIMKFTYRSEKIKHEDYGNDDCVGDKTPAIGSDEYIYAVKNFGFIETVLMAYNNHWNLRTSPEDWWYCVISKVARAIDENSKKESVRGMFVEHEGKKQLTVKVPEDNIYDVDYTSFFNEMEKQISDNVKVPEYVDCVTADFSTTTPVQRIVSQITLMSSLKEFFEFSMELLCGIPAIEMLGTEEDWKNLLSKLKVLRTVLEPIENDLCLGEKWWSHVEVVFSKLLETYRGLPDKEWWSRIVSRLSFGSGPVKFHGWLMEFVEGEEVIKEDQIKSGLVSTPLTIVSGNVTDKGELVAGMIGYTVHEETENKRVSVQPFHGWSLMLSENSPFLCA